MPPRHLYIAQRTRQGLVPAHTWDDGAGGLYVGEVDADPAPRRRPVFLESPIDLADETQRRGGILLRIRPELTSNVAEVTGRSLDLAQGLLSTVRWALVIALVVAVVMAGVAWVGLNRNRRRA